MSLREELAEQLADLRRQAYDASAAIVEMDRALKSLFNTDLDELQRRMVGVTARDRVRAEVKWLTSDVAETRAGVAKVVAGTNGIVGDLSNLIKALEEMRPR